MKVVDMSLTNQMLRWQYLTVSYLWPGVAVPDSVLSMAWSGSTWQCPIYGLEWQYLTVSYLWPGVVVPDSVLSMAWSGSTWQCPIYWSNRTNLCTYGKRNCLKWICFCMLNWIVSYWTVLRKTILMLNWIV